MTPTSTRPKSDDSDDAGVSLLATHSDNAKQQRHTQASQKEWVIDSGATAHMCNDKDVFGDLHEVDPFNVAMGHKSKSQTCGRGSVHVILYVGEKRAHSTLSEVLYVPNLNFDLVSVTVMDKLGYRIVFENGMYQVFKNGCVVAGGERRKNLYYLRTTTQSPDDTDHTALVTDISLWHQRLGHVHVDGIRNMARHGVVRGLGPKLSGNVNTCDTCVLSKITRAPVPKQRGHTPPVFWTLCTLTSMAHWRKSLVVVPNTL